MKRKFPALSGFRNFRRNAFRPVFLSTLAFVSTALAAPADLDSAFGSQGTALTGFDQSASARVVLRQPNGKIVVAGTITYANFTLPELDFALARYNADGSPDTTFGTDGKIINIIDGKDSVGAGALQPDGKIIIGGESEGQFVLVRYNQDGSLDSTFGTGGRAKTAISVNALSPVVNTILIQSDGKIIAVGGDDNFYIYMVRHLPNGTLDNSFGFGGKVTTRPFFEGNRANSALLQSDEKIIIGGSVNDGSGNSNSAIFRYNTDGSLDNSFDNDGVAVNSFSNSHDVIRRIIFRPDGKIMAVGQAVNAETNTTSYALSVYNADGTLATAFGSSGVALLPAINLTEINDAKLQVDGKIVIGGRKSDAFGSRSRFHLARFNADGTFDFTFGNGGKANLPIGFQSAGYSIQIQPDGKILAAGVGTTLSTSRSVFAMNRFQGGAGTIPTTAKITGRVINDFGARRYVGGLRVVLTGSGLTAPVYTRTNPFGFYRFANLPVGVNYHVTVESKKSPSFNSSLDIFLNGDEFAEDLISRFPSL